jgi:hypothetical protein
MGRRKRKAPGALGAPERAQATKRSGHSRAVWTGAAVGVVLLVGAAAATLALVSHTNNSRAAAEEHIDREVTALLAGIHQRGRALGEAAAPVTLEVFLDLKDPDSRFWFLNHLPAIIQNQVRTRALKLEYRAYKTNTFSPQTFIKEQTAALAAGAQNKLWDYIDTFYHEQGNEFIGYVTEPYLENIARQIPGLDLAEWRIDRHTGRREEQTTSEDRAARELGLHVTPSFRIGKTSGAMHNFSGHAVVKYKEQHPIALPTTQDIDKAIRELRPR